MVREAPEELRDGIFSATADQRGANERNEFAYPANPGGAPDDNPLLYQVEQIEPYNPAQNRRPARFASLDPYDPTGIRIGTFVLFPEVEIGAAGFSNVFASPNGRADIAGELRPNLRLVSNWSNHALEFQATGDLSNHREFGSENDRGYRLETRGRLDVTRRTNLQASLRRERGQEDRSAIDAIVAGPRSNVTTDEAAAALTHRFNRLSIQLRGAITDTNVSDSVLGGVTVPDRDETERRVTVRAAWEFKPTFSVFAEVEGNDREFEAASTADNLRRDSDGRRIRAGLSFGNSGEILRGDFSVGYGSQDFDERRLTDADGFIVDANLAWRINGLTSLLFVASSDIPPVTQTVASGAALERAAGLEIRHAFRNHLIGSAGIGGTRRDYAGIDVDETEFTFSLGLEYFLSREVIAFSRYEHTVFRSDFANSDYEADEVRAGVRLRR